jgi:hypothetical protein
MEMLGEIKADADRAAETARHQREARRTKGRSIGTVSAVTASALRRAADRLDPAPPQAARTTGWASG